MKIKNTQQLIEELFKLSDYYYDLCCDNNMQDVASALAIMSQSHDHMISLVESYKNNQTLSALPSVPEDPLAKEIGKGLEKAEKSISKSIKKAWKKIFK